MPLNRAPASLSYPTFVWNQYDAFSYRSVGSGASYSLPLDTSNSAVITNPAGWTIAGPTLVVPDGLYAITWYWEQEDFGAVYFDNYIDVKSTDGASGEIYPTGPMANPVSGYGTAAFTGKLVGVANSATNVIIFIVNNYDGSARGIINRVLVTRLDA